MPRAEIFIEDATEGANVKFNFPGGFDAKSPGHQLANILRMQLDRMAHDGVLTALATESSTQQGELALSNE